MSVPGLDASEVWLRYSRKAPWALTSVNLTLPTGSLVALVGANGAGKSTLFRTWLGFERPERGSVRVMGIDPAVRPTDAMRSIAYVAQDPALYRSLSCTDHLAFARSQRRGFSSSIATEALLAAGVPLRAKAGDLSGGQRVQLSLAIARGCDARVLLLDEPLANLDPVARRGVLVALADYARERDATVLVSSHLIGDVEGMFDRLVLMAAGTVVLADTIDSVTARASVEATTADAPLGDLEVGRFLGRDGGLRRVVMGEEGDGTATLEDVVLAYMSRATRT